MQRLQGRNHLRSRRLVWQRNLQEKVDEVTGG